MRANSWQMFGRGGELAIKELAELMADTVTGDHDSQIINFFATPLFGDREDLAYLQGSRGVKSLRLGPFGIRQLERYFKDALSIRGVLDLDVEIQVAQFRVYYWTMTICLTYGTQRQRARKNAQKSRSVVDKLTSQIGVRRTQSR